MITEHPDVTHDALRDVVSRNWSVPVNALEFLTGIGGDSWSYRADDLFINVREALGQRKAWSAPRDVEPPLRAAMALQERCGLEFLLTPTPTTDGAPLARLGAFAATLFPYLEGHSSYDDDEVVCDEQTMAWIERLHAATAAVADLELPSEDFRPDFAGSLREIFDRASIEDPYGRRVDALLESSRDLVLDALVRHEAHGDRLRAASMDFVVTHAEPAGNVHIARDGKRYLVDLVELKRAPRERDLRDFPRDARRDASVDEDIVTYYNRGFALSEVAEYGDRLTRPHVGDAEDDRAWEELGKYIEELRTVYRDR